MSTPAERVFAYHELSKHAPGQYAPSAGYLDWDTQPDPFRTWSGAPQVLLPLLKKDPPGHHLDLYERPQNAFWDFTLESVAAFLELSMGLSAWKTDGHHRWALRMNPSSGNLHPTECHLILPPLAGRSRLDVLQRSDPSSAPLKEEATSEGSIAHYNAYQHALESRAATPPGFWERIRGHYQTSGFFVALSSILWRESWKYGERALRYCHHDAGHALAALSFAGNLLGWKVTYLNVVSDEEMQKLLGFDSVSWPEGESEEVDLLCFVHPASRPGVSRSCPSDVVNAMRHVKWRGRPSQLSRGHVDWSHAQETQPFLLKPSTPEFSLKYEAPPFVRVPDSEASAAVLIRQRRSAVAYDGVTSMSRAQFLAMLDKTLPRNGMAPFDSELGMTQVHLAVFVHRVTDLPAGLYLWVRRPEDVADLRKAVDRLFVWKQPLSEAPLYLLKEGDYRQEAALLSCHQTIAGRSAFSLGMLARFQSVIDKHPWMYKPLFWETGMIGQVLYLEAEAQGLRATGIGCFFDDVMHKVLGLQNNAWQSLYHFTVGGSVHDIRLTTEPAYKHLPADRR